MTREERNRKISELRGHPELSCKEPSPAVYIPIDWHADANWPTLLREMPEPSLRLVSYRAIDRRWECYPDRDKLEHVTVETAAEAVCEAWLKWKES